MQLRYDQLAEQLKQPLAQLYWIASDDPYLQQDACQMIQSAARAQGFSEHSSLQPQSAQDWQQLSQQYQNLSLFAEQKVWVVHVPSGKFDSQAKQILQTYLDQSPEQNLVILRTPKIPSQTQKAAWFKKLLAQMVFVPIWPLNRSQFARWLQQKIHAAQLDIHRDALALLANQTEGNLLAAAQEIEKFSLIFEPKHTLTTEDISFATGCSAHYDVFTFVADVCEGQVRHVVQGLDHLQHSQAALPLVLWALARELRAAVVVLCATQSGQSISQALQTARLFGQQQQRIKTLVARHTSQSLKACLQQCQHIDGMIKGLHPGEAWLALQQTCLRIAGKPLFQGQST